jgi:hypothetical protein
VRGLSQHCYLDCLLLSTCIPNLLPFKLATADESTHILHEIQPLRTITMTSMLERLPEELLLEIFCYLRPLRKETSQDFYVATDKGKSQAITSLCLTSKRLSLITTPMLYSEVILSQPDDLKQDQISLFLRTVLRNPVRGQQITYIEHKLVECSYMKCRHDCDHGQYHETSIWAEHHELIQSVASTLWDGRKLQTWEKLLRAYPNLAQLILLLRYSPNITHIYIYITNKAFDWGFSLLCMGICTQDPSFDNYELSQLEKICTYSMQGCDYRDRSDIRPSISEGFYSFLQQLPSLRHYSHTYACEHFREPPPLPPHIYHLPKLEVLDLQGNSSAMNVAIPLVNACHNLKTLKYGSTGFYDETCFDDLHAAMLSRSKTLEHITLSMESEWSIWTPLRGSFSQFTNFRSLDVGDMILLGIPDGWDTDSVSVGLYLWTSFQPHHRLSSLLPSSLESLYLNREFAFLSDETELLWDFVHDLAQFPLLRVFGCRNGSPGDFVKLSAAFAKCGVDFMTT